MVSAGTQIKPTISEHRVSVFGSSSTRFLLLNALLIVATIFVYAPVRHFPFVNYDDPWYVARNPYIQSGVTVQTLSWAFFTPGYCHNWHPLTWISHAADIQMFGLDPGAHHDMNVLLHIIGAMLLFWVLRRATGYTGRSFMVAALFAVHPINVEAVAWISERKTLLSMVFFLLAFAAYRRYAQKPNDARYASVAFFYICGLMAKPQVIMLPVLLLLWDYWPLQRISIAEESSEAPAEVFPQRSFRQLVVEKIPLFVIAIGSAIMTMFAQEVGTPQKWPYSLSIRSQNVIYSYAKYIAKAFWPSRLAPFYPHPGNSLSVVQVTSCLLFLLLITGLVFVGRRRRYLVVGWLWFLIALLPMIGIIQVWEQGMADRYAYQPFIGLFIMVCWGVAECASRFRVPAVVLAGVSVAVLCSLMLVARYQTRFWANSIAIWTRSLEVTPKNNQVAQGSLGYVLRVAGRRTEAMPYLLEAVRLKPSDPGNNLQLAICEQEMGNAPAAIEYYKAVVAAPNSLAEEKRIAFQNIARAYTSLGNADTARQYARQADAIPAEPVQQP